MLLCLMNLPYITYSTSEPNVFIVCTKAASYKLHRSRSAKVGIHCLLAILLKL